MPIQTLSTWAPAQLSPQERLIGYAVRGGVTYLKDAYGSWSQAPAPGPAPAPPRPSGMSGNQRVYLRGSAKKRVYKPRYNRFQQVKAPRTLLKELKNHDINDTTKSWSTSSITLLNGIAQGDTESTRDGRRITPDRLEIQVQWNHNVSIADVPWRALCVVDMMPDGSTPAVTDILESATTLSLYNLDNAPRFKICMDVKGISRQGASNLFRREQKYWVCNPGKCGYVSYSDSGSTVTSIIRGACYFILINDTAPTTSQGSLVSRYRFIDQ